MTENSSFAADLIHSPLGKPARYITQYTPELLFPISRQNKRDEIKVPTPLPFHGADLWNAYELSWLNSKGKPEIAIGEFIIACETPYIVESKSFKLYLNSFNQTCFKDASEVRQALKRDLCFTTGGKVQVSLMPPHDFKTIKTSDFKGICLDDLDIECKDYHVNTAHLTTSPQNVTETLYSHLLKSNCAGTAQPDWGSIFISYAGEKIDHAGLLRYIISFREHNEFNEQCVERIFMDITRQCHPKQLTVYARYTRRGGLDTNPFRSNFETMPVNERLVRQ